LLKEKHTGATSGIGTAYLPSGAHEFSEARVARSLVFYVEF